MKEVYQLDPEVRHEGKPDPVVSLEEKAGGAHDAQNRSPCRWNGVMGLESFSRIPGPKSAKKTHSILKGATS